MNILLSLIRIPLVNNVGKSHEMPVYFQDTELQELKDIVQINVYGTMRVTQIVLPTLLARFVPSLSTPARGLIFFYALHSKNGLILNLSSFAASVPSAMLATYAGSKGFVITWSQALAEELKQHNITVELVNTFFVVSAMSKIRKPTISTPLPPAYVKSVLSTIGNGCGAVGSARPYFTTPYWSHAVADFVMTQIGWMSGYMAYTHSELFYLTGSFWSALEND